MSSDFFPRLEALNIFLVYQKKEKQNPFLGLIVLLPIGPLGQTLALKASWDNFNKKNFRVFAMLEIYIRYISLM